MRVISNTSPLIALAKLDKLNLLQQLFEKIIIPSTVYEEFLCDCPPQEARCFQIACDSFIEIMIVQNKREFNRRLDLGECEVLTLALEQQTDIILIDDRKAFNEAKEQGIKTASTRAILKVAHEKGFIEDYHELIAQLATRKFFIPNY